MSNILLLLGVFFSVYNYYQPDKSKSVKEIYRGMIKIFIP